MKRFETVSVVLLLEEEKLKTVVRIQNNLEELITDEKNLLPFHVKDNCSCMQAYPHTLIITSISDVFINSISGT